MSVAVRKAIVISASSDIGGEICKKWAKRGWQVFGTYRKRSSLVECLESEYQVEMIECDLLKKISIEEVCNKLKLICGRWDVLVLAPGRQEPVGNFDLVDFDYWVEGVHLNFIEQLRVVHNLLPFRNLNGSQEPCVLFFAGGGTNNAVVHYSSYTVSKIALIKMCELLDAEVPNTRFVIVGPGWVKTKIHQPTLELGAKLAGENYQKTVQKLNSNECTPMDKVVDCCSWLVTAPSKGISGRNFSVVFDKWDTKNLEAELEMDQNMYKLRRCRNDWK